MRKTAKNWVLRAAVVAIAMLAGWMDSAEAETIACQANGLVYVEGGTFQMGSDTGDLNERPVHTVTVRSFYMGIYEVTQAEYRAVTGENPSHLKGDNLPVENVSWYAALRYCNMLSIKEGLTPCYTINNRVSATCDWSADGYRLPTEAEWEYAARGGKHNSPYKYSGSDFIDDVAWYGGNSDYVEHEVGTKKPNALGIYDMSGNVEEWCWDWFGRYGDSPAQNGPASGSVRIARGGNRSYDASASRCTWRDNYSPDFPQGALGIRVVRSVR
ncbi:MAG: formylglycine-generating enzyme family protein [Treponemataceae bacterium]|nr:formylglycine-generating enzyme family protein [Treponemataceae bacterium]MDE7391511.1 formylglycine-generating enzyme family protein [Treponemataceae bacterium]